MSLRLSFASTSLLSLFASFPFNSSLSAFYGSFRVQKVLVDVRLVAPLLLSCSTLAHTPWKGSFRCFTASGGLERKKK